MDHRILPATLAALVCGVQAPACRHAADPERSRAVDTLITSLEAATLTLNELDRGRYHRADSLFQAEGALFLDRFRDTLDRGAADALGNHYLVLRAAKAMGEDHDRTLAELLTAITRLKALRTDLASGALGADEGRTAIATERLAYRDLEANVHRTIDNYRTVQRAWEDRTRVGPLPTAEPARTTGRTARPNTTAR